MTDQELNIKVASMLGAESLYDIGYRFSQNMTDAWCVIEFMRKQSQTKQRIFWNYLYDTIAARRGHPITNIKTATKKLSSCEVLMFLTPVDICKAGLISNKQL